MLINAVPGVPSEEYPIYAETPGMVFSCKGQVMGGERFFLLSINIRTPSLGYYAKGRSHSKEDHKGRKKVCICSCKYSVL